MARHFIQLLIKDGSANLFLLFVLFTAGHSLSCYECTGSCAVQKVKTCLRGSSKCMSSTTATQFGEISAKVKIKDCAADCASGFMNIGIGKMSFLCCNVKDAPDPSIVPNGKKCYYCNGQSCLNTVSCSGSEDRCFKATGTFEGQSTVIKGCLSKSICDAATSVGDVPLTASCCSGNLCNGAQSITQSFLFLCCSLLSFILLH